jgi:hypothetical protein
MHQAASPDLRRSQIGGHMHGDERQAEVLCGAQANVANDDHALSIHHERLAPAKLLDAGLSIGHHSISISVVIIELPPSSPSWVRLGRLLGVELVHAALTRVALSNLAHFGLDSNGFSAISAHFRPALRTAAMGSEPTTTRSYRRSCDFLPPTFDTP